MVSLASGLLLSFLLAMPAWAAGPQPAVRHVATDACAEARCHLLIVSCAGLPAREVRVRELAAPNPRGAVIFTTGVFGIRRYDETPVRRQTVHEALEAGLEVFQVEWGGGAKGWGTGAEGAGLESSLCGYAEVVRWIAAERAAKPELICAQGNSGGALQIAYGLSVYGLEELLDMVILSGGPPISRMEKFCFGEPRESGAKESGRRFVDYIMGWQGVGDFCVRELATPPVVEAARRDSLITDAASRDLEFPHTKVNVVVSERDRTAREAKVYYEAVRTAKSYHSLPGSAHGIDETEDGAKLIRHLLLDECRER